MVMTKNPPVSGAIALVAAALLTPLAAETRLGNVVVAPLSPGAIRPSDRITATFDFSTDEAAGVLVFAPAFSGGQMVLGTHSGSFTYTGTGSASFWTTLPSGYTGVIDHVLVVAATADMSRTVYKAWIPVEFHVGAVKAVVTGISPPSPSALLVGEHAVVSLDYAVDNPNGMRMWTIPNASGAACQGSVLVGGSGSTTRYFLHGSGINNPIPSFTVRCQDDVTLGVLAEYTVPVDLYWSSVSLQDIAQSWSVTSGEIHLSQAYNTTETGIRIDPDPRFFDPPGFASWTSDTPAVHSGSGIETNTIRSISPADAPIKAIRYEVSAEPGGTVLLRFDRPFPEMRHQATDYITDYTVWPARKARLPANGRVYATFHYTADDADPKLIFVRPLDGTSLAPGYAAHGSALYTAVAGSGAGWFTFPAGSHHVSGIQIQVCHGAALDSTLVIPVDIDFYQPAAPVITRVSRAGADVGLWWTAESFENYRIWRSTNLLSWANARDQFMALNTLPDFTDPGIAALGRVFYRIEHKPDYNQP